MEKLWFFISFVLAAHVSDSASSTIGTALESIIPTCIFGVDNISFILFTRDFPGGRTITLNESYIPINEERKTMFLVHGFTSEANASQFIELASTMLGKKDMNIFSVDWSDASCSNGLSLFDTVSYPSAVTNCPVVGEYLANFTVQLMENNGLQLENIEMVGHSLGAHICGFAGKSLRKQIGMISRITGLDPAGPGFTLKDCQHRLCDSDARYVDVFHTSVPEGIQEKIGLDNFYFNGGKAQPGCPITLGSCSHSRSIAYLTETIRSPCCKFLGTPEGGNITESQCTTSTCNVAGPESINYETRGSFNVKTNSTSPYCPHAAWIYSHFNNSDC